MTTSESPRPQVSSHQSGTIKEHWNDLPATFLTPRSSAPTSRSSTPLFPTSSASTTTTTTASPLSSTPSEEKEESAGRGEGGGEEDSEMFEVLLETLFTTTPSTLSKNESKALHERVKKQFFSISKEQRSEVAGVVRKVAVERVETPAWGRERIVEFITRERGVAGWAGGVRRGVECVSFEKE